MDNAVKRIEKWLENKQNLMFLNRVTIIIVFTMLMAQIICMSIQIDKLYSKNDTLVAEKSELEYELKMMEVDSKLMGVDYGE